MLQQEKLKNNKRLQQKSMKYLSSNEKVKEEVDEGEYEMIRDSAGRIVALEKLIGELSNKRFRDSVLEEAKVLFYCEDFLSKLDEQNKHLVAFTNGVYDLHKGEFREGRSEDYLCRCTGYAFPSSSDAAVREELQHIFDGYL